MWSAHSLQVLTITACPFQTGAGSKPYSLEAGQAAAWSFDSKPTSPHSLPRGTRRVPIPTTSFPFSEKPDRPQPVPCSEGQQQLYLPAYPSQLQPKTLDKSPQALCSLASAQAWALEGSSRMKGRSVQTGLVSQACRVHTVTGSSRSPHHTLHLWDSGLFPAHRGAMGLTGTPTPSTKSPLKAGLWGCPLSQRLSSGGRDRCDCVSQREFTFRVTWLTAQSTLSCLGYPSLPGGGLLCIQCGIS